MEVLRHISVLYGFFSTFVQGKLLRENLLGCFMNGYDIQIARRRTDRPIWMHILSIRSRMLGNNFAVGDFLEVCSNQLTREGIFQSWIMSDDFMNDVMDAVNFLRKFVILRYAFNCYGCDFDCTGVSAAIERIIHVLVRHINILGLNSLRAC